jgi:hypothetical protein
MVFSKGDYSPVINQTGFGMAGFDRAVAILGGPNQALRPDLLMAVYVTLPPRACAEDRHE